MLDDHAAVGEVDLVGDLAREAHLVGHQHAGHALLGEVLDGDQHLLDRLRVERGGDLVEEHDVRAHGQRAGDCHALLLSAG